MRIDALNSANEIVTEHSSRQIHPNAGASAALHGSNDRTTLSADSASITSLAAKALQNPAVRQDRIESLRQSIHSGSYQIEPGKIAASIIDETA